MQAESDAPSPLPAPAQETTKPLDGKSKDWWLARARSEGDTPIGAGVPDQSVASPDDLREIARWTRMDSRPSSKEGAARLDATADALDALAEARNGCEVMLGDGTLCGEYSDTRIALCRTCGSKRDAAISTLTRTLP